MTDVIFSYWRPISTMDTAIRFPPGGESPPTSGELLMIDNSSFVLLIDGLTMIELH